ncbi:hypothetical protein NDU88_003873 [Pleurodeles waltl]|uniref:Uncharacterized protein n=1 Tax=Pleurodeles waltl TaxID=8319 RepID=A0AAV7W3D0_PLEWA|nr:hypothetical protein NDU88_003873 [Pleurodeles waltl]
MLLSGLCGQLVQAYRGSRHAFSLSRYVWQNHEAMSLVIRTEQFPICCLLSFKWQLDAGVGNGHQWCFGLSRMPQQLCSTAGLALRTGAVLRAPPLPLLLASSCRGSQQNWIDAPSPTDNDMRCWLIARGHCGTLFFPSVAQNGSGGIASGNITHFPFAHCLGLFSFDTKISLKTWSRYFARHEFMWLFYAWIPTAVCSAHNAHFAYIIAVSRKLHRMKVSNTPGAIAKVMWQAVDISVQLSLPLKRALRAQYASV